MTMGSREVITELVADHLEARIQGYAAGHCVRVDDVSAAQANALVGALRSRVSAEEGDIWTLSAADPTDRSLSSERAIELRNRKRRPLLLLVPAGEGYAASSLDNSFERISFVDLVSVASLQLRQELAATEVEGGLRALWGLGRAWISIEEWADFLAAIRVDATRSRFGRELWRLGLVPDLGSDPESRLTANVTAARAIARPSRTVASVSDRLVVAGVRDDPVRSRLAVFLDGQGALSRPRGWAEAILVSHPGELTFECWPLVENVTSELSDVTVLPFVTDDGRLDRASKLRLGDDGQPICEVPVDGSAQVVVQWKSNPPKIDKDVLARWIVEIVPPVDLRTEDTPVIGAARVSGTRRRASVKIEVSEDDLAFGTRFVARLTAEDSNGQKVELSNGDPLDIDSQEFEVWIQLQSPGPQSRKATAGSIAEASLRAAIDGIDDRDEDLGGWDLDRGIFSVRLGGRRIIQIQVSPLLVALQRRLIDARSDALYFDGSSSSGRIVQGASIHEHQVVLPATLADRRAKVMALLKGRGNRDTVEALGWDGDLRDAVVAYVSTYRRALDAADDDTRRSLLRIDSLTVKTRTAEGLVKGVVLLPTHPLRLMWASQHDAMLRSWADALEGLAKPDRARSIDRELLPRIIPANLPFALISGDDEPVVYFDELTYGAGLYLDPGSTDPEADAAAVCSALGLSRRSSRTGFAAAAVSERILAYAAAHPGSAGLRLVSLNPGTGELLDDACRFVLRTSDQQDVDPTRLEVLAYSDRVSYTAPLAPLAQLQSDLRLITRDKPGSHLTPPLSLSVRPVDDLLNDDSGAHVAIIQGLAQSTLSTASEAPDRAPSLEGLLVPTVFTMSETAGGIQIITRPAVRARAGQGDEITAAHRSHQAALGALLSGVPGSFPALSVEVSPESLARLSMLHARADWVLTIDRQIGVGLFDGHVASGLSDSFILDYAPDFIDGIGDRLTVTTVHRDEVERILAQAMRDLDLETLGRTPADVLESLGWVSGRLALRLLGDSTLAREAVSLSALMLHLQDKNELDGVIVIPVDAHPELFGPAAREGDGTARRCDLILVRVGQRSFKIEYIEVKARRRAQLPQALADVIVDQLEGTEQLLRTRIFATDPAREDAPLQWARWAGLLHYYADRSASHGFIPENRLFDVHRYIDRIEEQREQPDVSLRGFVVSVEGDAGFPRRVRDVPITVLTSRELGRLGFTTMLEAQEREARPVQIPSALSQVRESSDSLPLPGDADVESEARMEASDAATSEVSVNSALPADSAPPSEGSENARGIGPVSAGFSSKGDGHSAVMEVPGSRSEIAREGSSQAGDFAQMGVPEVLVELGLDAGSRPVSWTVSTQGSPHAFILGIPGQGKSVTTRKILRDFASQGLPSLVLDFHGDMAAEAPSGVRVIDASQGLPFSPFEIVPGRANAENHSAWEIAEILAIVFGLGEIQRSNVYRALQVAYANARDGADQAQGVPSMDDFIACLEQVESGSRGKNARARLTPLTDFGLFAPSTSGVFDPVGTGGMIIDVSALGLEQVQLASGAFMLRKIYNDMFQWPQKSGMRLAVVLDEAHRLARDTTLPRLMKEGRKYGVSVVVASQGVEDFHQQVLENAGTKIVFRTNFPASKRVAGFLRGRGGQDLSEQVEQLGVGQAYVSTPDHAQARKVYMFE
jgi:DNA phosphorothioation-dependent restriction protein DptH